MNITNSVRYEQQDQSLQLEPNEMLRATAWCAERKARTASPRGAYVKSVNILQKQNCHWARLVQFRGARTPGFLEQGKTPAVAVFSDEISSSHI